MFKNLRIGILNWLAAGRMTLTYEKPKEHTMSYSLGGTQGTINITPTGYDSVLKTNQTLTVKITPANGGTIVQVQASEYGNGDLHIIPNGSDFDKELGKIITLSKLKS